MRGRVVAAERKPQAEQEDHHLDVARRKAERDEKRHENDHLGDEHGLAAEAVRQAAERESADENAKQTRRADDAMLIGGDVELALEQRERDAGHENNIAFEEFARGGKRPDQPLHAGHRRGWKRGSVRPHGQFVDMLLNRPSARHIVAGRRRNVGHGASSPLWRAKVSRDLSSPLVSGV
jgi:hypothetical protein